GLAAFSVVRRAPLDAPAFPPEFDAAGAKVVAADLAGRFPDRGPGTAGAEGASAGFRDQLRPYGFAVESDRFETTVAGKGRLPFENLAAIAPGRSPSTIVIAAHRDNDGAGAGANDNASGTAAL